MEKKACKYTTKVISMHIWCAYHTSLPPGVLVRMLADFGISSKYRFVWKTLDGTFHKSDSTKMHKGTVQWHFNLNLILNNSKLENETHQSQWL